MQILPAIGELERQKNLVISAPELASLLVRGGKAKRY